MKIYKIVILGILIIVCLVYAVKIYRKILNDMKAAQQRIRNLNSKVFHSQYGDIEYILSGEHTNPTILVSHGITGGVDQAKGIAETYLFKEYQFLFISRFGYLKSDLPKDATPKMQADVYKKLLDHLKIDQVYILGNSAGGTSAFHFALNYSKICRGLILLSTNLPQTNEVLPPKMIMKAIFGSDFMYYSVVQLFNTMLFRMFFNKKTLSQFSKEDKARLRDKILMPGLPISERNEGVFYDMYISNPSLNSEKLNYGDTKVPSLIIHASDDPGIPIESARNIVAILKNVTFKFFDEGGHIFIGHEEEIKKIIYKFTHLKSEA